MGEGGLGGLNEGNGGLGFGRGRIACEGAFLSFFHLSWELLGFCWNKECTV